MIKNIIGRRIVSTLQAGFVLGLLFAASGCAQFDQALIDAGFLVDEERHGGSDDMLIALEEERFARPKTEALRFMPLGQGVLLPDVVTSQKLPREEIGPYELRGESLAGALQFILAEFDIPLAVETDLALQRKVTITNLKGPLDLMVEQLCAMSDLYCIYNNNVLSVSNKHDYAVSIPPSGGSVDILDDVTSSIAKVVEQSPVVDRSTRTVVYQSTRKQAATLARYFEKLRANMALINYEVSIWSVELDPAHRQGVLWESLLHESGGRAKNVAGLYSGEYGAPISIGLPYDLGEAYGMYDISGFLAEFGRVKAISKPSISVMSGGNGLWNVKETPTEGTVQTGSVKEVAISLASLWDGGSIFSDLELSIQGETEKKIKTQMRLRPGDGLVMAGMMDQTTIGTGKKQQDITTETVIMLRPKVVVYRARKDYYGINGLPVARGTADEEMDVDIWQSVGDEPLILVPESAPWPPMPAK